MMKKTKEDLRDQKVFGVSLMQWLVILMLIGGGLLLVLQHWFG